MKKILLLASLLLPICGAANTTVYCPETVICQGSNVSSCVAQGQSADLWGKARLPSSPPVAGVYVFDSAWVHHNSGKVISDFCSYKSASKPLSNYILLPNLENRVYESYAVTGNRWRIASGDSSSNTCESESPYDCPYRI